MGIAFFLAYSTSVPGKPITAGTRPSAHGFFMGGRGTQGFPGI